jgi:hypothetical protein
VLTADGWSLLVANAASDVVSVFAVAPDASLTLVGPTPVGSALALRDFYSRCADVPDAGDATDTPQCIRLGTLVSPPAAVR